MHKPIEGLSIYIEYNGSKRMHIREFFIVQQDDLWFITLQCLDGIMQIQANNPWEALTLAIHETCLQVISYNVEDENTGVRADIYEELVKGN